MTYTAYESGDVAVETEGPHVILKITDPHTWAWVSVQLTIRQAFELGSELAKAGLSVRNKEGNI